MKDYNEILVDLEEYKKFKFEEINKLYKKNDLIQTLDKKFGYTHGTIRNIFFDDKKGEYYLSVRENKHNRVRWSSYSIKTSIYKEDFDKIKVIENPVNDYIEELEQLINFVEYEVDELPLTKSERDNKINEAFVRITEIQHMCIHNWEDVEEGSWLNKKRIGYKCSICELFDEDREE